METIAVDYMTLTSAGHELERVPAPSQWEKSERLAWQAGPALYEGWSYRYADGSLQRLWSKEQGALIRISGALCERILPMVSLDAFRLTRLDLCVSVDREIDLDYWYARQRSAGVKVKVSLINGETLYVGSRKSDRFWRIYNKALEQGIPGPLYRIELELKGERSCQAKILLIQGKRLEIFLFNRVGVVENMIDELLPDLDEPDDSGIDLSLPRRPPAGKRFLERVIMPFLKRNKWAIKDLIESGILEEVEYEQNGDM
jgi:hypothetical protein